ncbi:MAG TPA: serine/threonine-protein kinase [Lacunisphaera sp.]|nr:serine/threonine-protein kinase [Lacunisphaera sp.]
MADYNGYKIKRTHSLTPFTSVYEAEGPNGNAGKFALKVFHPPASSNLRRQYAIEGWLLAAERQQQCAKKDGAVLEVLTFGRCEEGAFAVYPWRQQFLEPWIKTLHPKGNTLRALAECLFNAIEKWEKETGGPHGNLKPANVFPDRPGALDGMTVKLSDPAYQTGAKVEERRLADLAAVGTMLATIVRRRAPGAWPIEEAPEWKALGHPGKGWLDFCNYLLNPQPAEGEVTLAKARLRLKKVPYDANPAKTAALTLAALLVLSGIGVVTFARVGNPIYMPEQLQRVAQKIGNKRIRQETPPAWGSLCAAWDAWLVDVQSNGPRLLRTEGLMDRGGILHTALTEFLAKANDIRPEALVPEAAAEKRLGVLGKTPPEAVLRELQLPAISDRVTAAGKVITNLQLAMDRWSRWAQLRDLQQKLNERGFARTAEALGAKLPPAAGSEGYKQDTVRTLKLINDISLDSTGTLPLVGRWNEISKLSAEMLAVGDRIQKEMPRIIVTERLTDQPSLGDFADSLVAPLDELRLRRKQFNDPQVVRDRFLKESDLLTKESAPVTAEDFPRWEKELVLFSLVPDAENPSKTAPLDAQTTAMTRDALDLERETPEGEADQPATLNDEVFKRELAGLNANLANLRKEPIVRRDLPEMQAKTTKLTELFEKLKARLVYTLSVLKPETWKEKARRPYGNLDESKDRYQAWWATIEGVDPATLKTNRERFRALRASERKIKDWIDGLEGPDGFGALKMPNLTGTGSEVTVKELQRLESLLRERAAKEVGAAETWTNALPATVSWNRLVPNMREPLDRHSAWLGRVRDFAINLDQLRDLLADGMGWKEGVSELMILLRPLVGGEKLLGVPGSWYDEAAQLEKLVAVPTPAALKEATQSGRLSLKLAGWRGLGEAGNWPAGPTEFEFDSAVVKGLRELVAKVKVEERRTKLAEELAAGVKARFNRAAMFAASAENLLTDMFSRLLATAGLKETDLEPMVATNYQIWRLKRAGLGNEKKLDVLGAKRDAFVDAMRAIDGGRIAARSDMAEFLTKLSAIDFKNIPDRATGNTPSNAQWSEEIKDDGMTVVATWKNGSGRVLRMEYAVVEPLDDTPPFFLSRRVVSVGEFLELMNGRPKERELVLRELRDWATKSAAAKPYDMPLAWRPRDDFTGVLELNPTWIYAPIALTKGLLDANSEARTTSPAMEQMASETPTLNSPLQQVTSSAAKIFAEKMLGARLPTIKEWNAAIQATGATVADAHYRGPKFQQVFEFVRDFRAGGQIQPWRPNAGVFTPQGVDLKNDDGRAVNGTEQGPMWFRPVEDGPAPKGFVNLLGNISIFLTGENPSDYYVAGGSVLSPPGIDFTKPQKITAGGGMIGGRAGNAAYSDVGIRPAFDAPPGFKERYTLLKLVREQKYLTL